MGCPYMRLWKPGEQKVIAAFASILHVDITYFAPSKGFGRHIWERCQHMYKLERIASYVVGLVCGMGLM